jgi:multiple sugar transport system permease protein
MAVQTKSPRIDYHRRLQRANLVKGLIFISPAILGFLIFTVFPVVESFYFSLTNYDILQPPSMVWLNNYKSLFQDKMFLKALQNTLYMVLIGLPIHLVFDLSVALLLNAKVRALSVLRTIFYMPSITPVVAGTVLWLLIFNGRIGLLNAALNIFNIQPIGWLADPNWMKPAFILMTMWAGGQTILILLAGLQDVPTEELESADLDGAGVWSKMWNITLPTISPVMFYLIVLSLIGYFQIFTEAYVLTADRNGNNLGGPAQSLLFYTLYLYQQAFQNFNMGYASAMAWVLLVIVLAATYVVFRTSGWVYYRSE